MADPFQIIIDSVYKASGVQLARGDLEKLADLSKQVQAAIRRLGSEHAKTGELSWRSSNRIRMGLLESLGVHGPLTAANERLEYMQYMADRTGLSVGGMLAKFGPTIAIAAGVSILAKNLNDVADAGARAFSEAGLGNQDWIDNLKAGMGLIDAMRFKVEDSGEAAGRQSAALERFVTLQNRAMKDAGQAASAQEQISRKQEDSVKHANQEIGRSKDIAADLEKRRNEVGTKFYGALYDEFVSVGGLGDVNAPVVGAGGAELAGMKLGKYQLAAPITKQVRNYIYEKLGAEIDALNRQAGAARTGEETRAAGFTKEAAAVSGAGLGFGYAAEERATRLAEARATAESATGYSERIAARKNLTKIELDTIQANLEDKAAAYSKDLITFQEFNTAYENAQRQGAEIRAGQLREDFDNDRRQRLAHFEAIANDETRNRADRVAAIRAAAAEQAKTMGEGEKEKLMVETEARIRALGRVITPTPGVAADALTKIGGFVGGSSPLGMFGSNRIADLLKATHGTMLEILRNRPIQEAF
jgi:hypothetical protein